MSHKAELKHIPIGLIERNHENPRLFFRQEELEKLLVSVKKIGLQVPISVYKDGEKYIIIDGERRWRTFLKLNFSSIPAIIQEKPSELENLLLMFNIHGLREQWDIFTIANKIEKVIRLISIKKNADPTEDEISLETGMTRGVIRRCKLIIALPQRFKDLIKIELEKPKREQVFSEDFFLEMEQSLRTVERNYPHTISDINVVRDVLIKKYKEKVINNVTDFRKLTKIATANKNLNFSISRIENALRTVLSDNSIGINEMFKKTVEDLYDDKFISNNAFNFLNKLESLNKQTAIDDKLKDTLLKIRDQINNLLN